MPSDDCQLILILPARVHDGDMSAEVSSALAGNDIAAVLMPPCDKVVSASLLHKTAINIAPVIRGHGVAFLLAERDTSLFSEVFDGMHLFGSASDLKAARQLLGRDAILGGQCAPTRHDAMTKGESRIDYLAFGGFPGQTGEAPPAELIGWWSELFRIPSAAFGHVTPDNAAALAATGADFIAPELSLWEADNPGEAVRAFRSLIRTPHA